jgi:hypothetical protein
LGRHQPGSGTASRPKSEIAIETRDDKEKGERPRRPTPFGSKKREPSCNNHAHSGALPSRRRNSVLKSEHQHEQKSSEAKQAVHPPRDFCLRVHGVVEIRHGMSLHYIFTISGFD